MTFSPKSNFRLFAKQIPPFSSTTNNLCTTFTNYKLLTTVTVIELQHEVREADILEEIRKLKYHGRVCGGVLPVEELPENSAVGVASTPHPDVFLQTQILHLMLHSEDRRHTIHICIKFQPFFKKKKKKGLKVNGRRLVYAECRPKTEKNKYSSEERPILTWDRTH